MYELPRIAVAYVGCKVNQSETEGWSSLLRSVGAVPVTPEEPAEALILNSCTVTHRADRDVRRMIHHFHRINPEAPIIVAGCMVDIDPGEILKLPGVAGILTREKKGDILTALARFGIVTPQFPDQSTDAGATFWPVAGDCYSDRGRAFLKVQDGCNAACTYCIVPKARGAARSRPPDETALTAKKIEDAGFGEIVLTGVHLGQYGRENASNLNITKLFQLLLDATHTVRFRLSSIEPEELEDELLCLIKASQRICPHLHIPLQSGSSRMLRAMGRRYSADEYKERVSRVHELLPEAALGTDIIVGFPGESADDFEASLSLAEQLPFTYLHVFGYSERKGTPAAKLSGSVPIDTIKTRVHVMQQLAREKNTLFREKQLDTTLPTVIIRQETPDTWRGLTHNYLNVWFHADSVIRRSLVQVKITGVNVKGLIGVLIESD